MNRISAGGNLSIEIQPARWRLVLNGAESEKALLEANFGEPLTYGTSFGATRRLPDTGVLPTEYVQRVVLGWSNEDETWHLGLLLQPELAKPRGSRWCEIVNWPDESGDLFVNSARQAGESLAAMMGSPFYFVPMQPRQPEAPPPPPLPPLPDKLELWTINKTPTGQIDMSLPQEASSARLVRGIWYLLLSVLYFGLSALTLVSGIALPRPEFLPFIGLASAVVLLIIAIRNVIGGGKKVDRVVAHPEAKAIRGMVNRVDRWRFEADDLKAIYATAVTARKPKRDKQKVSYGELNLQLADGTFRYVLSQGEHEVSIGEHSEGLFSTGIRPLTPLNAHTHVQIVALHISQMLGIPAYTDVRYK